MSSVQQRIMTSACHLPGETGTNAICFLITVNPILRTVVLCLDMWISSTSFHLGSFLLSLLILTFYM